MRVTRGLAHTRRRKRILKQTKGYRWGRKTQLRKAKEAILKAGQHAFRGRKQKKRDMRALWQIRINAAVRQHGLSYSKFMGMAKKANLGLDRKILSQIAAEHPNIFAKIVELVKK